MSYLPDTVMYSTGEMKEVSRNKFKIFSVSADQASASKIVNYVLPENALIDTKSIKLFFDVECLSPGSAGGVGDVVFAKLPNYSSTMLQRVEVFCNGIQLSSSSDYNVVAQAIRLGESNISKDNSVDRCLQHSYITGNEANDHESLCVQEWNNFFDGSSRWINSGLLGAISIRATYAPNSVLVPKQTGQPVGTNLTTADAIANAQQMSYVVTNQYMTVDTATLSSLYTDLLRERLDAGGLSFNYPETYIFQNDGIPASTNSSNSLRFALSSGCINKCLAFFRDSNATGVVGIPAHTLPNASGVAAEIANCLRFRSYSGQTLLAGAATYQYLINNVNHAQFRESWFDLLADVAYSCDKISADNSGSLITSTASYNDGKFIAPVMLEFPTEGTRIQSGYNSRGVNTQCVFQTAGCVVPVATVSPDLNDSGSASAYVVALTTAKLIIQKGRDLIVQY